MTTRYYHKLDEITNNETNEPKNPKYHQFHEAIWLPILIWNYRILVLLTSSPLHMGVS